MTIKGRFSLPGGGIFRKSVGRPSGGLRSRDSIGMVGDAHPTRNTRTRIYSGDMSPNMELSARDYAGRMRDPRWERRLALDLRGLSEGERLDFCLEFSGSNPIVALDLARRCLGDRESFEAILRRGLREADASSIRYWLEAVVPALGLRRLARLLEQAAPTDPEAVRKARYWLGLFADLPGYQEARETLDLSLRV